MIYVLIIVGLVLLDQVTKILIDIYMVQGQSITIIPNFLSFSSVRNSGAAWSMLENQMTLFYIITVLVVGVAVYYLIKDGDLVHNKLFTISMLLIISGTIGNFIDRLFRGEVIDFINFTFINFPVFNIADTLLTIGMIGFAYSILFLNE